MDLVAVMLRYLRQSAEAFTGTALTRAVIGRQALFSDDPARERIAQERLERAAAQAGVTDTRFELEPVAGAYAFAADATVTGTIFVADYGGGTSDFTVMEIEQGESGRPRAGEVLATHGVRVGGDNFDAAIMWERVLSSTATLRAISSRLHTPSTSRTSRRAQCRGGDNHRRYVACAGPAPDSRQTL